MEISNGRFVGVPFVPAADQGGTLLRPRWILIHYTGGAGRGAIGTLTQKDDNYVSAHTFTDTEGGITQLVSFKRQAYHAGVSAYGGVRRLNAYTIGLELANPGYVRDGHEHADWPTTPSRPHKSGGPLRRWFLYPAAQVESATQQCAALMRAYGTIEGVLGHDDVCDPPGRKLDPGPGWDWIRFRERLAELR